ncbi:HAD family hydrolase [Actinophytocola sp.]|uniref:HAD family hydrolase n=1 Tax=Actinophytocola sp. TaxID=1872138 RepID=UPI002D4193B5|nr:HAD family hydrolase [Actinophytocola sp.]HYQ62145.1 HAD family hydrolase [Actinophytocola sp.]
MNPAVLFDLDGTLIDTPSGIVTVLREVLAEGGRTAPEADIRATVGRPLDAAFSALVGLPPDSPEVASSVARFRLLFRERVVPGARELIFPGILDVLAGLRGTGRQLAIVTSKVETSAREILAAAGMVNMFDVIVCHGMAPRGKPFPDLALLAANLLGRSPEQCVVVGDSVDDVRMAVAAGMRAVGVGYGVATPDQLGAAGADVVVAAAAGLPAAVGSSTPGPAHEQRRLPRSSEPNEVVTR